MKENSQRLGISLFLHSMFTALFYIYFSVVSASSEEIFEIYRIPSKIQIENFDGALGAADSSLQPKPLTYTTIELIKHFEGWHRVAQGNPSVVFAYDDPAGFCTIGYGHLISRKLCRNTNLDKFTDGLSEVNGTELLKSDTSLARRAVLKHVGKNINLTNNQYGALSSFVFNVGSTNFKNSTMLQLIKLKKFEAAEKEFRRWVLADGKVYNGLVERRKCEAALFANWLDELPQGTKFNRRNCERELGAAEEPFAPIDLFEGENLKPINANQ